MARAVLKQHLKHVNENQALSLEIGGTPGSGKPIDVQYLASLSMNLYLPQC